MTDDDDRDDYDDNHIRNERTTREHYKLVGAETSRDLTDLLKERNIPTHFGVPWCNEAEAVGCSFMSASHALTHLRYSGSMAPCRECLMTLRTIIDDELAGIIPGGT
jgi:hypothetical protein